MEALVGVVGSLGIVGLIVGLLVRKAMRDQAASLAGPISQVNAAMRRAAEKVGLVFEGADDSYGVLTGKVRGVPVAVRVGSAYLDFTMTVSVGASKALLKAAKRRFKPHYVHFGGEAIVVVPTRTRIKVGNLRHWVLTEPDEIVKWIHELVDFVTPTESVTSQ